MTETNDIKVARLETQMANIEKKVDELGKKIDAFATRLDIVTELRGEILALRETHNEHVKSMNQEMENIRASNEKEIQEIKSRNILKGWLYPTLSAIAGSVVTFLILEYLKSRGNG
jgi:chromosome segregation ATPase